MKKTKVLISLMLVLLISIIPFSYSHAHNIELDPNDLITFPERIYGGNGSITIKSTEKGYTLYYQGVEIPDADFNKIKKLQEDAKSELDSLEEELKSLIDACDEAKSKYEEELRKENPDEEEQKKAQDQYNEAKNTYQERYKEYEEKYSTLSEQIRSLVPAYVENSWTKTEDGKFSIDSSTYSGTKAFVVWVKLVSADGTITYDEGIYSIDGNKVSNEKIESITLNKTSITITEGSSETLTTTIIPSDAIDKTLIWSSEDESIAKVENGKVTAISAGTTKIKVATADGSVSATCTVTVTKKDPTTANKVLAQTGEKSILPIVIIAFSICGIVMYKKVTNLKLK